MLSPCLETYIIFPGRLVNSIPPTDAVPTVNSCPLTRLVSIRFQFFCILPRSYVSVALGIISELTSVLIVTESVNAVESSPVSPKIIFPSSVILLVACKFPCVFKFACTSIVPVPLVSSSIFAFVLFVDIKLSLT